MPKLACAKIKRFDSIDGLLRELCRCNRVTLEEYMSHNDPNTVQKHITERIKHGMYGLLDDLVIYAWFAPKMLTYDNVLFLVAHELWHLKARSYRMAELPIPGEETVAMAVANIARSAHKLIKQYYPELC